MLEKIDFFTGFGHEDGGDHRRRPDVKFAIKFYETPAPMVQELKTPRDLKARIKVAYESKKKEAA